MKRQSSYDWGLEASVQAWLEELTGEPFPSTFADSLKSGQILCKAVNLVKPGTIPKIETSTMSFKQMENISYFLRACRALGVKEYECFETLDLYQVKWPFLSIPPHTHTYSQNNPLTHSFDTTLLP